MESIAAFIERYNREHREERIAALIQIFHLSREDAEAMYTRMLGHVVEAAMIQGDVDPGPEIRAAIEESEREYETEQQAKRPQPPRPPDRKARLN